MQVRLYLLHNAFSRHSHRCCWALANPGLPYAPVPGAGRATWVGVPRRWLPGRGRPSSTESTTRGSRRWARDSHGGV